MGRSIKKQIRLESLIPNLMAGIRNKLRDAEAFFTDEETVRGAYELLDISYQEMKKAAENGMCGYRTHFNDVLDALETLAEEAVEEYDSDNITKAKNKLKNSEPYQLFQGVKKEKRKGILYGSRSSVPKNRYEKILNHFKDHNPTIYQRVTDLDAVHQTDILERMRLYVEHVKQDDISWESHFKIVAIANAIEDRLGLKENKQTMILMDCLDVMAKNLLGDKYPQCRIDLENRKDLP